MVGPRQKSGKKGKGKKKKANENDVMHVVDKTFYELQILDLTRKLARQRSRVAELEETVIQLDSKLGKANEDHGDIIQYLKRNLTDRSTEVADLQLKVTTLIEQNAALLAAHEEEIEKYKEEYTYMQEQLMTRVKMLTAQLNALDDYRIHREELLQKFEEVQNELDEQEQKFKKQIYELEKKTILGKANLKREMEERMFNLATQYQQANQIRIAATSQRTVRENIALNNEMNKLIGSTNDLNQENLLIKQQFKKVIADYCVLEEGHKKIIHKSFLQNGVIRELTNVNLRQKETLDIYEAALQRGLEDQRKLKVLMTDAEVYNNRIKILERKLNAARYSERELQTQLSAETKFRHHLEIIVDNVRLLIKSTLFEHPEIQQKIEIPNEENLLTNVIDMLTYSKADVLPPTPYGTVSSMSSVYRKLDCSLSQTQRIVEMKPPVKKINVMTYLGASFEDFLNQHDANSQSEETEISEKTITDENAASCSEETLLSTSTEEQTSSSNANDDLNDIGTLPATEYEYGQLEEEDMEEEDVKEEDIEEEDMEKEKMDEEKEDDNIDDTY